MIDKAMSLSALGAVLPIYIMIAMGFFARKIGWMSPLADKSFMKVAIDLTLPCFILVNMLSNKKLESVEFSLITIAIGALGLSVCMLVSYLVSCLIKLKVGEGKRTFVVTTATHNYGFFIISMIAILYANTDDPLLGVVFTHNVGCDLVFWTVGFLLISSSEKISPKVLLKGPILAVIAALFLIWTGLNDFVLTHTQNTLRIIGGCAIPLNLFMFGNLLCDFWGKEKFNVKIISTALFTRVIFLPALFITAATLLPIDMTLKKLLVFQAVAPCGVTAAVLAKHFGGYPQMSVQISLSTCVAVIFTMPLWLSLGFKLIGAN